MNITKEKLFDWQFCVLKKKPTKKPTKKPNKTQKQKTRNK